MIGLIHLWRDSLPDFLKPREKTLAGQRTFERQNTVLKLGHAHLSILATRRCLLMDFSRIGRPVQLLDGRARNGIRECVVHISTIINAAHDLLERGELYQAFWFTQYISLVAISTLFVLLIQDSRISQPEQSLQTVAPEVNLQVLFEKAKICQRRLAALSPEGSQSHRHHRLLDRLRIRCEKDMMKTRKPASLRHSTTCVADSTGGLQGALSVQPFLNVAPLPNAGHQRSILETNPFSLNELNAGDGAMPVPPEARTEHLRRLFISIAPVHAI